MESMVVFGIGLAAFYWICESFMYFFMKPEANFIQHLFGPGKFEIFSACWCYAFLQFLRPIISTPLTSVAWQMRPCWKAN